MKEGLDYEIQVSSSGDRVWINGNDGSCIGRFDKRTGIDIHNTVKVQMATDNQCLHCKHGKAGPETWHEFRSKMMEFYRIAVPDNLIRWSESNPERTSILK